MKAIIHYNGLYEDSVMISGNTIEDIKLKAYEEINKRGWKEKDCWSEVEE